MSFLVHKVMVSLISIELLIGCTMAGVASYSEPYDSQKLDKPISDGVIKMDGISISVKPQNSQADFIFGGPIIPIIPLGAGNSLGEDKAFEVVVQFEAQDADYSFSEIDTLLHYIGNEYQPNEFSGPLISITTPREMQRLSSGHGWTCSNSMPTVFHNTSRIQQVPVTKSCFLIKFPINTPSPDNSFQIEVRGLRKSGQVVELPKIEFRPSRTGYFSILG